MSAAEMRMELKNRIDALDEQQLEKLYDVIEHFNGDDEWDEPISLSEIDEAIAQVERGEVYTLEHVLTEARAKYGLNG